MSRRTCSPPSKTRAFAAASLGQVHRARLKTGQEVAVKIQYPGIARAVREDFRNLFFFLLPGRLSSDWENTREQFEDLRTRIEREADYLREAASLQRAASLFTEADGIVVPRVFPDYSTSRVLTMQRLEGLHLNQFLATNPSQELRNEFARKIVRAWYRMLYAGRVIYVDYNPGNFIFNARRAAGPHRFRLHARAGRAVVGNVPQDGPPDHHRRPRRAHRLHQEVVLH
jgi:predicted unusual protein kinase regulating ubiquinone biosynthesis (AarF/ABC1/UbiB family)